jgi:hypothetical protein
MMKFQFPPYMKSRLLATNKYIAFVSRKCTPINHLLLVYSMTCIQFVPPTQNIFPTAQRTSITGISTIGQPDLGSNTTFLFRHMNADCMGMG